MPFALDGGTLSEGWDKETRLLLLILRVCKENFSPSKEDGAKAFLPVRLYQPRHPLRQLTTTHPANLRIASFLVYASPAVLPDTEWEG
jgi:hypothetical protein